MLVLSRKTDESIVISGGIRITVVEIGPGRVRLGITAPDSVRVDRQEIHDRLAAAGGDPSTPSGRSRPE